MKRWFVFFLLILLALPLSACGAKQLSVREPWARPAAQGENSAVYFVIDNPTAQDDTLLGAATDVAMMSGLHRSVMEEGVMKMQPQEAVSVPAKSQVEFKPGDYHVMLMNLKQDLKAGDTFPVTLKFEKAGEITVEVTVREP